MSKKPTHSHWQVRNLPNVVRQIIVDRAHQERLSVAQYLTKEWEAHVERHPHPEPPKTVKPGADPSDLGADPVKPWTIRGIPPEERTAAIAAAERADMTLGQWLTRAIKTQVQIEERYADPAERD